MSTPVSGVLDGLFWVPDTTVSEHGPMVSVNIITGHLDLVVTVEVGESGPESVSSAPSGNVGGVDGTSIGSIAIGHSVPMSSEVVRADLVSSAVTVEVSVVDV